MQQYYSFVGKNNLENEDGTGDGSGEKGTIMGKGGVHLDIHNYGVIP